MKTCIVLATALLFVAAPEASARPVAAPALVAVMNQLPKVRPQDNYVVSIRVAEFESISLPFGSTCTWVGTRNAAVATGQIDNGLLYGGVEVHGIAPGYTVVDFHYTDRNGVARSGTVHVHVRP